MLLVHVVGNADLGLCSKADNRPRLASLREVDGETAAELLGLLDGARSGTETWFTTQSSPLCKALTAARDMSEAVREGVEVLVVGGAGGRGSTDETARVICQALSRACRAGALAQVAGDDLRILDEVVLSNGLNPAPEGHDALRRVIGDHQGHVVLTLGGGASAVLMSAAGAAASTHPKDWSLLLTDRSPGAPGTPATIDMSNDADARKGWLMGLGLPTLLRNDYLDDADVTSAAEQIDRACGTEGAAEPDDLALLLQCDAARGDLAAGLAARAWLGAEYRRRLAEYNKRAGASDPDRTKGGRKQLGPVIGEIKKRTAENRNPAEQLLLDHRTLNTLGANATHEFQGGEDDQALARQVSQAVGAPPDWLSWPSGRVVFLAANGVLHPSAPARVSMLRTLLDQKEVPFEIRQAAGTQGPLTLTAFLTHSQDGRDFAQMIRKEALDAPSASARWAFDNEHSTTHDYGASLTKNSTVDQAEKSMTRIRDTALDWLEKQERPRAVVVGVVGEKPVQIALLSAAQEYGARHGAAVFLVSTHQTTGQPDTPVFHQFGLARDVRNKLLEATVYCLDRLDLHTAARLLRLGDLNMSRLADEATGLAQDLVDARNNHEDEKYVGTILDVMAHVADVIDDAQPDAQARLAVIIGELFVKQEGVLKRAQVSKRIDVGSASREQIVGLLIWIRNRVTLTHGTGDLPSVTKEHQDPAPGCKPATYPEILRHVIDSVPDHDPAASNGWAARMRTLRREVEALRYPERKDA